MIYAFEPCGTWSAVGNKFTKVRKDLCVGKSGTTFIFPTGPRRVLRTRYPPPSSRHVHPRRNALLSRVKPHTDTDPASRRLPCLSTRSWARGPSEDEPPALGNRALFAKGSGACRPWSRLRFPRRDRGNVESWVFPTLTAHGHLNGGRAFHAALFEDTLQWFA